jgi:hypothetical protein
MTTWSEQRRAATRERLAFTGWWAALAFACGAGVAGFIWMRSPTAGMFAAIVLAGAWLGPVLAWASMRAPRRNTEPWPGPGAGYDMWRRQANAIGRMLLYHQGDPALPQNVQRELREAHSELRSVLRTHPSGDNLERECTRLRNGPMLLARKTAWLSVWPQVKDLEARWRESAGDGSIDRHHLLHELVGAAAAAASEGVLPRLLARERWECVELSTDYALQLAAAPGLPLVSPIALAAALAIDWGDFSVPLDPEATRADIAAFFAQSDMPPSIVLPVPESLQPSATPPVPSAGPAAAVSPPAPKRYRRVRVKVRHEHHHHRSILKRIFGEPIASVRRGIDSFSQWLRYSFRAWWMYR